MVDFRYHLVSILAVFMALAVGIVLGTTTIDDAVVADLKGRVEGLTKSERDHRAENDELSKQAKAGGDFAREVLPIVLAGRLEGERVVIVTAPGGQKSVREGLVKVIEAAGGTVGGRVQIQDKLADPAAEKEIDDLVSDADILPPDLNLPAGSPVQRTAAVLASVLATSESSPGSGGDGVPATKPTASPQATTVLAAFREAGLVRVEGAAPGKASMFIVVAPIPPATTSPAEEAKVRATTEVVAALGAKSRAVVVAAPRGGAESNSVLSSIRRDPSLASDVSSVDGADATVGQIAAVLALVERSKGGFGHYGTGPGADDSALPDLNKLS
jgi:hypothetical protein